MQFQAAIAADKLAHNVYQLLRQPGMLPQGELDTLFGGLERPLAAIANELRHISGGGNHIEQSHGGNLDDDETLRTSTDSSFNRPCYAPNMAVLKVLWRWIADTAHTPNKVLIAWW